MNRFIQESGRGILRRKKQRNLPDEQIEKKIENGKLYQFHTGNWIYVSGIVEHLGLLLRGQGAFLVEKLN